MKITVASGTINLSIERQAMKSLLSELFRTFQNMILEYMTELNEVPKSEKSGSSVDDIYVPKLFRLAQTDSFLRPVPISKNTSSNFHLH